jgi:hypothetical protein
MWRTYALIELVWAVLMPPFFTGGACTAQFDEEADRLNPFKSFPVPFNGKSMDWAR